MEENASKFITSLLLLVAPLAGDQLSSNLSVKTLNHSQNISSIDKDITNEAISSVQEQSINSFGSVTSTITRSTTTTV